jgi:hypothetical protein
LPLVLLLLRHLLCHLEGQIQVDGSSSSCCCGRCRCLWVCAVCEVQRSVLLLLLLLLQWHLLFKLL